MFSTTDTIVAIATPPGRGGIGVIRLSGPSADAMARRLTGRGEGFVPRYATLTTIGAADGTAIDRVIVTVFPSPHSYTGDDVAEISAHGSPIVLQAIVKAAIDVGARLAEPGEFTLRAYLNGRIDLAQAEAIADLIDAVTPLQARSAFDQLSGTVTAAVGEIDRALFDLAARLEASVDFPGEGYHFVQPAQLGGELDGVIARCDRLLAQAQRGRLIREGCQVVIAGPPNAGKSSLFNALVGAPRAIVTEMPGTTRDLVTEVVEIDGVRVTLVDTAGLREAQDLVEAEGIERSRGSLRVADVILLVSDLSLADAFADPDIEGATAVIRVGTKSDLPHRTPAGDMVKVSALTGDGLGELRSRIAGTLDRDARIDLPAITNVRHLALVERARSALIRARAAVREQGALPEEFLLADLQEARVALEEISGRRTTDDLLAHVFSSFCIGK